MNTRSMTSSIALALLVNAGVAAAQDTDPVGNKGGGPVDPNRRILGGTDVWHAVMDYALGASGANIPVSSLEYNACGSSGAQIQLEGGYTFAGQPTCTPLGTGAENAGCQEIAPMSRLMNDAVCNDTEASGNAESLAVCADSVVVMTDNASYQSTSTSVCTNFATTDNADDMFPPDGDTDGNNDGKLFLGSAVLGSTKTIPGTSYTLGAGTKDSTNDAGGTVVQTIEPWQDVLRIIYTGYKATDPWGGSDAESDYPGNKLDEAFATETEADPALTNNRTARCGDAVRAALLNNWYTLFESADCGTGRCGEGLRAAYRRDDVSGTTGLFLDFIDVKSLLIARAQVYGVVGGTTPTTEAHSFCDGGDREAIVSQQEGAALAPYGDPVRKPCAAEDDVCGRDGQMGVVRAIRSVPNAYQVPNTNPAVGNQFAFPTKQCTRNVFRMAPFAATGARVCPDGNLPLSGQCFQPVYTGGGTDDFNCINPRTSRPPGAGTDFDGRVYNFFVHGTGTSSPDTVGPRNFEVAQWRQNSVNIPAAGNPTTDLVKVCQEVDATANIGCIVGNTTCTLGFSGQQSALPDPYLINEALTNEALFNEALVLNTGDTDLDGEDYLARLHYINAIGGFENVMADCMRRDPNQAPGFCQAQVDLVNWFSQPANAARACAAGIYLPLPNGPTCHTHVSASCVGDTTPECVAQ